MAAAIYSLYIINKSGGLIFFKDYGSAGRMDTNDTLRVASLWHSMHAISQQLSPVLGCSGIEMLKADTFDLHCFQSLTVTVMESGLDSRALQYLDWMEKRAQLLHLIFTAKVDIVKQIIEDVLGSDYPKVVTVC